MNLVHMRVKGTLKGVHALSVSHHQPVKPFSLLATLRSHVFAIAWVTPREQLAGGASAYGELDGGAG